MPVQLLHPPVELAGQRVILPLAVTLLLGGRQHRPLPVPLPPPVPDHARRLHQHHQPHGLILRAHRPLRADDAVVLLLADQHLPLVVPVHLVRGRRLLLHRLLHELPLPGGEVRHQLLLALLRPAPALLVLAVLAPPLLLLALLLARPELVPGVDDAVAALRVQSGHPPQEAADEEGPVADQVRGLAVRPRLLRVVAVRRAGELRVQLQQEGDDALVDFHRGGVRALVGVRWCERERFEICGAYLHCLSSPVGVFGPVI